MTRLSFKWIQTILEEDTTPPDTIWAITRSNGNG